MFHSIQRGIMARRLSDLGLVVSTDYLLGANIALPSGVTLRLDLPCTTSSSPPTDASGNGRTATAQGSPSIQSSIVRPGKSYASYTPGTGGQAATGSWRWTRVAGGWNDLVGKNWAAECWAYLPTGNLVSSGNAASGFHNALWGAGSASAGGPSAGVINDGSGAPFFRMRNGSSYSDILRSGTSFPFNTWTHLAVTYENSSGTLTLYQNGVQVAQASGVTLANSGSPTNFFLGATDNNSIYAMSFAGYQSNFRIYTA